MRTKSRTAANFWSVRMRLKRSIAGSRFRNGRCEFSARLLSQRPVSCPDLPQRWTVGPKSISDDDFWSTMLSHCLLEEFQCGFLVPGLGYKAFQNLNLVIDGAPEVVPLAVDLHENLVEMDQRPTMHYQSNRITRWGHFRSLDLWQ